MSKALVIKGADFSANKLTTVTFDGVHTDSISVSPATISATVIGATSQITATVIPSDSIDPVQWVSSDNNVATVDNNGVITITGCGSCTISAVSGGKTASCTVTTEVELSGYIFGVGTAAKPVSATNTVPGWATGFNPDTGEVSSRFRNRASTIAVDQTETRLSCDYELMTNTGGGGTLKPVGSRTGWMYRDYGWTVPVLLPNNCSKIKVYALNADYGSIPLFYKSDVVCDAYSGYICTRKVTGWTYQPNDADLSQSPWTYAQMTEYDVPSGYDSVIVNWFILDGSVSTASPLFTNMTDAQKSAFKVICC